MNGKPSNAFISGILAAALLFALPALANHKPGHDKDMEKSDGNYAKGQKSSDRATQHGPPPWAPAHGYRTQHRYKSSRDGRVHVISAADLIVLRIGGIGTCNRETLGAILGAVAGSQVDFGDGKILAKVGGAIAGALIGGAIGRAMDQVDQNCIGQTLERAPNGTPIGWRDGSGRTRYEVTPTGTIKNKSGRYCRTYQTRIVIDGRTERAEGTACRRPDGSWEKTS